MVEEPHVKWPFCTLDIKHEDNIDESDGRCHLQNSYTKETSSWMVVRIWKEVIISRCNADLSTPKIQQQTENVHIITFFQRRLKIILNFRKVLPFIAYDINELVKFWTGRRKLLDCQDVTKPDFQHDENLFHLLTYLHSENTITASKTTGQRLGDSFDSRGN